MIKHILILEDDGSTRIWFSDLLMKAFGEVHIIEVESIGQAEGVVDQYAFSMAFVDIYLPDGRGIDFIERLKRHNPSLFCIVFTAYDDSSDIFEALKAGADGYLLKSQDKNKLVRLLCDIMEGAPPLSPSVARRIIKHFSNSTPVRKNELLTNREEDVLIFISKGMTRNETADLLKIRPGTVAGYIKRIYEKLNVSSRAEAALEAQRMGLV